METWQVVLAIAVVVGVVAFLVSRKQGKTQAAQTDMVALAHKLGDALQTVTKANAVQGVVLASAPVQAAINAGTPPPPQPQGGPPIPAPVAQVPASQPAAPASVSAPQSIQPPPHVKVDPKEPAPPIATTQPAPPALPTGDQATREKVALAVAFGYGSPPYRALQAQFVNVAAVINQYRAGGPDTDPTFNASHASPRDYGYTWNGGTWVSPANPVGGTYNAVTQRFE